MFKNSLFLSLSSSQLTWHTQSNRSGLNPGASRVRARPRWPRPVQRPGSGDLWPPQAQILRRGAKAPTHDQEGSQSLYSRRPEGKRVNWMCDFISMSHCLECHTVVPSPCRMTDTGRGAERTTSRRNARGTLADSRRTRSPSARDSWRKRTRRSDRRWPNCGRSSAAVRTFWPNTRRGTAPCKPLPPSHKPRPPHE